MATCVLIPGVGGYAWYWHLLEPGLRVQGHETVADDRIFIRIFHE